MIIACKQCHTRFKVPDGKVTVRGLKVRCSRCGHTFRVYPDSPAERGDDPSPAAARPRVPDPFEAFGPDGTSEMEKTPARGTTVSELLAQMSPAPAEDDFEVDVAGVEPPSTDPAWNFPPAPSRPAPAGAAAVALEPELPGPRPEPALARAPLPVRPLPPSPEPDPSLEVARAPPYAELDAEGSGAPVPPPPFPAGPGGNLSHLFEATPGELTPEPAAVDLSAPLALPRRSLPPEDLAALAGFTPAWGVAGPSHALSVDGKISTHVSSLAAVPEKEPSAPPEPIFGGAGTVLDDLPSLDRAGLPAHGELELDTGTDTAGWSGQPPGLGGAQLELEPELPSMELDRRLPPEPEPVPAPAPDLAWSFPAGPAAPVAAAPAPVPAPAPAPAPASLGWDDPFSEPSPPSRPPPAPPPVPEPLALAPRAPAPNAVILDEAPQPVTGSPDHAFFEMPSGPRPSLGVPEVYGGLLPDIPETPEPAAASLLPTTSGPMPTISKPPSRIRLGLQDSERPGTARQVSAVILNVGLAALLLLVVVGMVSSWATVGRVEGAALSPRRLLQALRPGSGVAPVDVSPGTYETRSGRSLLYVRGRVLNRGAPSARVRVRAEVWDGAQAVKSGETLAGAIATPEELWRAATPADVEALRARLLGAAKPVPDGQGADFLVLLDEAPRDLSGLRLKVTATVDH
ncbi:MAG TPA: zinc-ribbon domain-containing protein [Myxococcaceae bacterium]